MEDQRTAVVSRLIMKEGWDVGWLCREEPDNDGDSGWRIFAGAEDEDDLDKPGSFSRQPLEAVVDLDPTIEGFLDSPVGSAFERIGDTDRFREQDGLIP